MTEDILRPIQSELDANHAVLESGAYARAAGFDEASCQMIATSVSELARNILKYAGSGEVRLRALSQFARRGVEIEALDYGPGIIDCDAAMSDHFSSSGTLGMGLPGVQRMMDEFTLESSPGKGTKVTARKWI